MTPSELKAHLSIEHRICRNSLGESDNEFVDQYVEALSDALIAEYPGARIDVNLDSDFCNDCQTFVTGRGDGDFITEIRENVNVIANVVWDRMV